MEFLRKVLPIQFEMACLGFRFGFGFRLGLLAIAGGIGVGVGVAVLASLKVARLASGPCYN